MSTVGRGFTHWLCHAPRWAMPVCALALGLVLAAAMAWGGQPGGWWVVALFTAYGAFLYAFSPRSEVVGLISGQARDERQRSINDKASTATLMVLVWALVIGFLVTTALGSELAVVFSSLSAFTGLTWLTALVVVSRRT